MAKTVLMKSIVAGPDHVLEAGKVYNLHDSLAAHYVQAGAAEYVDKSELNEGTKILKQPRQPDPEDQHRGKPAPTVKSKADDDEDEEVEEVVEPTEPRRRGPRVPKPSTTPDPQGE